MYLVIYIYTKVTSHISIKYTTQCFMALELNTKCCGCGIWLRLSASNNIQINNH